MLRQGLPINLIKYSTFADLSNNLYETRLPFIASEAEKKEEENDHFLISLNHHDDKALDALVHQINEQVSSGIDCTQCGNCCQKLIINITHEEIDGLAAYLKKPVGEVREEYIEESMAGNCFINTIPCHFLADNKCSIYTQRFTECRDFPHLHKPGFRKRFSGTLMHYGSCPIIYNVVEILKTELEFKR